MCVGVPGLKAKLRGWRLGSASWMRSEGRKRRRKATVERDPGRQKPESIFMPRRDNSQAVIKLVCHISFHCPSGLA